MGHANPPHSPQEHLDGSQLLDESTLGCGEYADDEHTSRVLSLIEENARLRGLVVKLSEVILRNVMDKR
jgi:hypothetical protein